MTTILFDLCNLIILLVWGFILFFPRWRISENLISYPWVPLGIALGYIYFLSITSGTFSADFSSLNGLTEMFQNANPQGVAAGWLHYLAFDFWVGCWMLKNSQEKAVKHPWMILPLLCTFMLGPVGVLIYSLVLLGHKKLIAKTT